MVSSIDNGHEGSLKIHQDAVLSRIDLDKDATFEYQLKSSDHGVYVMNISGEFVVDNETVEIRDAIGISEADSFIVKASEASEVLFIEVPMNL